MDNFATYFNIANNFAHIEDYKSLFNLSIAFGKEYVDYYNSLYPKPISPGDIITLSHEAIGKKYSYIVSKISVERKNAGTSSISIHKIVDRDVIASEYEKNKKTGKTHPVQFKIRNIYNDNLFCKSIVLFNEDSGIMRLIR
jgi:hypothetical protein